ncbi:MAG: S26 family signal peptidase [Patescibacteria group bacterium]
MLLLQKFKIQGHSMEPKIKDTDVVLVSFIPFLFKNPAVGDIVAFNNKGKQILIKRIKKIENGRYYVRGDNKDDSLDSRNIGFISKSRILGQVIYKL